jgi:hypothetical protein
LLEEIFKVCRDNCLAWIFPLQSGSFGEDATIDVIFLCFFSESFDFAPPARLQPRNLVQTIP